MERRAFIKSGCGYCAAIASVGVIGSLLESCAPSELIYKAESAGETIVVPVEKLTGKNYLIIRSPKLEYDILLVKDSENAFHALAMQCTHRQQPLVVTSTGLICNEHGSRFDMEGKVTQDPATRPLARYKTEMNQNNVLIYLL